MPPRWAFNGLLPAAPAEGTGGEAPAVAQQQGLASRLDALQEHVDQQKAMLVEQIRRLTGSQERTKRRQIQELEREVREMRKYVADLADQ